MAGAPPSLGELVKDPKDEVPDYAWTWHYFLKQGVDYNKFKELPLPYIFLMMKTADIEQQEREKELDN